MGGGGDKKDTRGNSRSTMFSSVFNKCALVLVENSENSTNKSRPAAVERRS